MSKKALVVYYSQSVGNTKRHAEQVAEVTGTDIARIETAETYPTDFNLMADQAKHEVDEGIEPELKPLDKDVADYDVIIVGTPVWWYTMAPAMRSWLNSVDFTGKILVPFVTSGGWEGDVVEEIEGTAKGAEIDCPMDIVYQDQDSKIRVTTDREINMWLADLRDLLG